MNIIQSIGPPPERYADRIIGEMMRKLAQDRSQLWDIVLETVRASNGASSPRAQRRLEKQLAAIPGIVGTDLEAGKHGRFNIVLYNQIGWSPSTDAEILAGDLIPDKPWIACNYGRVDSRGRGHNSIQVSSRPIVFLTHHAMSRMAQRFGLRTANHMTETVRLVWNATVKTMMSRDNPMQPPIEGWRVPLAGKVMVVLKRHPRRRALIAATVLEE